MAALLRCVILSQARACSIAMEYHPGGSAPLIHSPPTQVFEPQQSSSKAQKDPRLAHTAFSMYILFATEVLL